MNRFYSIKQADNLEEILTHKFMGFLEQRAEQFKILRRKPVEGFNLSFLVTDEHLIEFSKDKVRIASLIYCGTIRNMLVRFEAISTCLFLDVLMTFRVCAKLEIRHFTLITLLCG